MQAGKGVKVCELALSRLTLFALPRLSLLWGAVLAAHRPGWPTAASASGYSRVHWRHRHQKFGIPSRRLRCQNISAEEVLPTPLALPTVVHDIVSFIRKA